ncbi:hypothetical protein CMQ_2384 [Grosmannia clavigera kw1407]|uniref:GPN-loop GTPase 1 n=1 Tax=Grosmannia clavigera (strain kw1407 / UAMH 11150) TaxID=655863 RepID=F0XIV5_GROCL|nr:uncharacterized protein CMQ_2384 [Grosmannia clavigera kw1407]EFX02335.1 hypothetical protein CMQ_2384 [Grosmannia clavigera kw1407]
MTFDSGSQQSVLQHHLSQESVDQSAAHGGDAFLPETYHFPTHQLRALQDSKKKPLVLVVCGSFSPITIMHLRMCEMAFDWVRMVEDAYEVVGMYLSPVSAQVLDHFRSEINEVLGGITDAEGQSKKAARVALLCGADLMQSMSTPGLWSPNDLDRILGEGGLYVVERHGTDLEEAKEALSRWTDNISVIPQGVPIDLSSTKVRLFLHKQMSVRYFVPNPSWLMRRIRMLEELLVAPIYSNAPELKRSNIALFGEWINTEDSSVAMESSTPPKQPVSIVCVGMAGSGKTTFMQRANAYLHSQKEPPYVINLDPAVLNVPFDSNIDIRDSVNYKEVMKQYNLGPNGGILTALNLFSTKIDQILNLLEKRASPDASEPGKQPIKHILVDTPGQIEAFVWSASGTILLESLASSFPTVIAYIIDTPRTASTSTFMSNMLYACSILYKTKLPMILVFNKTDVKDAGFAKEWMTDYDSFQAALREEEDRNAFGGGEGGDSMGGSGYMGSLLNSMSMMLEEFYAHLSVVGVSSMTGHGVEEFFQAVEEKADEFKRDYQPELERRRRERDGLKKAARQKELDKMMKGLNVKSDEDGLRNSRTENGDDDDGGAGSLGSDNDGEESDDDDADPDEEYDREGLQSRYEATFSEQNDLTADNASFAKYLHSQR